MNGFSTEAAALVKDLLRAGAVPKASTTTLICQSGLDAGRPFVLVEGNHIIGRSEQASIRLRDRQISRLHARIVCSSEGIGIEDLGGKNGVRINDRRVGRGLRRLVDGDRIRLGGTLLELRAAGGAMGSSNKRAPTVSSLPSPKTTRWTNRARTASFWLTAAAALGVAYWSSIS